MKTYYLLKIASLLSRYLPSWLGYWLCSFFGSILFYTDLSVRRAVMDNMRHVLSGAPARVRRDIARRVVTNTFKNYYDMVRLPHLSREDVERMVELHGVEHLEQAYAQGRGVIIISGHLGNFNLVAQLAAIRGYPVATIAEDIKPAKLYNYVNSLRARFGLKFIKAGSSQVRTIYRFLRNKGVLMLAADRDVSDTGVPVQFFDAMADLPAGPVVLALRLKCPLVPGHTIRLPNNKSVVYLYPPIELERTGDYEQDIRINLRRVAQVLEQMILKAPDQWVVLQRVWDKDYTVSVAGTSPSEGRPGEASEPLAPAPGTDLQGVPLPLSGSDHQPVISR
jgi:KDO2-lipid IV(A) lauroyltransferase